MTIKVLGIAPYPGLRDLLKQVAAEVPGIDIEVETADLDEALPLSKRAEEEGYDVIISRGGTATLVREHVSLPVVDISVSGYDILRVLTLVKDSNSKVAMVGFPNVCQGAATVSSLLDFELPIFSIGHESEVKTTLQKAFENGAQLVLGDTVTVKTAQEMGYHGILVTSGRESVMEALREVKHVYELYHRGQEQAHFYETLLDHHPQGVLVVEEMGTIRYLNPAAAQMLGLSVGEVAEPIAGLLTKFGQEILRTHQEVLQFQDQLLQIEIVATLNTEYEQYFIYLQPIAKQASPISSQTAKPERLVTFAQFFGTSDALQKTIERAKTFALVEQNIWLTGPAGSKRSLFAQAIHSASNRSAEEFHAFTCKAAGKEYQGQAWGATQNAEKHEADFARRQGDRRRNDTQQNSSSAIFSPESSFDSQLFGTDTTPGLLPTCRGTLYLAEIDHLPRHLQEKLLHVLQNGTPARLIVSSATPLSELTAADFNEELALLLSQLHLKIPALSERLDDIDPIARVMIAEHNSQYGKHIVGLRSEVLDRLKTHTWPGNVVELENVLNELLLLTKGHYVGPQELASVWERYEVQTAPTGTIDLSGNWEDIEKRILLQVLEEEGMNQSRAATRLGINRSTLWRKLRD